MAREEREQVDNSLKKLKAAEARLEKDLKSLDSALQTAYEKDTKFREAADNHDAEQSKREQLIYDLTSAYRGAQTRILNSDVKDEDKQKKLLEMSQHMHDCMSQDYHYKQIISLLEKTLKHNRLEYDGNAK